MAVVGLFMAIDRASAADFAALASDAIALGYEVEWDDELPGGDDWWARTLAKVERADAFIFVLTATSVASTACEEQLRYAIALGRPVLPVLLGDGISDVDLPPALGQLQRVDYREASAKAMAQLFSALRGLQLPPPSPQQPLAPRCPPEFAIDLETHLRASDELSRREQDVVLDQVGHYVRSGFSASEVEPVLGLLHERLPDLTVTNSRRLEELEAALRAASPPPALAAASGTRVTDGHPPVQSVFMSYSRSEREVVASLSADIRLLGFDVWIDENLPGGKPWWDQLLGRIREAGVMVFAAGPASLASRACKAELDYARALGTAIVRVDVDPRLAGASTPEWKGTVEVKYLPDDKPSLARLAQALRRVSRVETPAVLPEPPEVPATYLFDVQHQLRSAGELDGPAQAELLVQIGRYADEGVPTSDLAKLLTTLEQRPDTINRTVDGIKALRQRLKIGLPAADGAPSAPPPTSTADVPRRNIAPPVAPATPPPGPPPGAAPPSPPSPPAPLEPRDEPMPMPVAVGAQQARSRRTGMWVAAGVAVVALAGIGGAVALTTGGDDTGGADPTTPPSALPPVSTAPVTVTPSTAPPTAAPTAPPTAAPTAPPTPQPTAPQPTAPPVTAFQGVVGSVHVQWVRQGSTTYDADLQTNNTKGIVDVTYYDARFGPVTVREDLTLVRVGDQYAYQGSSPRYALSGAAVTDYPPDRFDLQSTGGNTWKFSEVCDVTGCWAANPFG